MNNMDGRNLIGYRYSALAKEYMNAINPETQKRLDGQFFAASPEEIDQAMELASTAFESYKNTTGQQRADFLNAIAEEIMRFGDRLVERAMQESGLPEGRIKGERGRTINQLKLFAKVAAEGSWVEASIDTAMPDRKPIPKADIRKMLVPVGPVVVYTASNFPLAFSTAGGDTASALASGCPVIIKAHESHLGTNAMVSYAIQQAAHKTGMPDGVFSSLNGTGPKLGQYLVKHPEVKSVAFTGSFLAGKAIYDAATERKVPIPVFAEMGSVNPVVFLPEFLNQKAEELANQYAGSVTLGVGQFCTNPGLLLVQEGKAADRFLQHLAEAVSKKPEEVMLNEGVCKNYFSGREKILNIAGVKLEGTQERESEGWRGQPTVASVSAADFLANYEELQSEVFGPFTLVVKCSNVEAFIKVIASLHGQLTGTVMGADEEIVANKILISTLQNKVGRLLFNGVPTGVEVCHSMHHGGPYPATTDSRFTSVGTDAIKRFARPVAFQNCLEALLPEPLRSKNPTNIWRTINGEWTNKNGLS
ncbi:MAG: aldehyde dehydrogenase (NADP(+)) [Saprospiraceae bacterium]